MHPMLNTAVKAARRAGQIINRASLDLDLLKVSKKQHNDFVTEVDKAAEAAIIETLSTAYPDHAILAEESGATERESDFQWIIDPLDGTTNFIHGFQYYCVSIALAHKGQVTQAVIFDPTRNDLYTASRGSGAFLNERRIRVGRRDRIADGLLGTGFPFRQTDGIDTYNELFKEMTMACAARAPRHSTWPTSRRAGWMASSNKASAPGTSPRAACSSVKRAGWSGITRGNRISCMSARLPQVTQRYLRRWCRYSANTAVR